MAGMYVQPENQNAPAAGSVHFVNIMKILIYEIIFSIVLISIKDAPA